jgi:hypothetical protein
VKDNISTSGQQSRAYAMVLALFQSADSILSHPGFSYPRVTGSFCIIW